jgi:hypothetical protein
LLTAAQAVEQGKVGKHILGNAGAPDDASDRSVTAALLPRRPDCRDKSALRVLTLTEGGCI